MFTHLTVILSLFFLVKSHEFTPDCFSSDELFPVHFSETTSTENMRPSFAHSLQSLKARTISSLRNVQKNHQWGGFAAIMAPSDLKQMDPFIFMVHHRHFFPKGSRDEGFPPHPHRGFETVTYAIKGGFDHGDSAGNKGTYGDGDVQWMTAGRGVLHSEMFLVSDEKDTDFDGFQIWLNLPSRLKMSEPGYQMLWNKDIPVVELGKDSAENVSNKSGINSESVGKVTIKIIAGRVNDVKAAVEKATPVSIFHVKMEPNSQWTHQIPSEHFLMVYVFEGVAEVGSADSRTKMEPQKYALFNSDGDRIEVANTGDKLLEFMLLEGKPFKEPIAHQGPFVMNTQAEVRQAFVDYQLGKFGYMEGA